MDAGDERPSAGGRREERPSASGSCDTVTGAKQGQKESQKGKVGIAVVVCAGLGEGNKDFRASRKKKKNPITNYLLFVNLKYIIYLVLNL